MPGMIQPERKIEWDTPSSGGVVLVHVKSLFDGEWNTMPLAITPAQYEAWQEGDYIQRAMPHLSPDEREFLLSGAMPGEFEAMFPEEDDDE